MKDLVKGAVFVLLFVGTVWGLLSIGAYFGGIRASIECAADRDRRGEPL